MWTETVASILWSTGGEMMDASYRDIEIVEDDMGEGYMNPIEENESLMDKIQRRLWTAYEKSKQIEEMEELKVLVNEEI